MERALRERSLPTKPPTLPCLPRTPHACSFSNIRARIPFEDLPYPGPVVALCQDIAIARASGLLAAEERLFWKLIGALRLLRVAMVLSLTPVIAVARDTAPGPCLRCSSCEP